MVLGFRFTHGRHRGSVLPRIPLIHARDGVRVLAAPPGWKEAAGLGCLVAMLVGLVLIIVFVAHPSRRLDGALSTFVIGAGVFEMARQYFRKRRLRQATLLVRPWPLRLGQRATVRFEKQLRRKASAESLRARLTCVEDATVSGGRYQEVLTATRHETELDTSSARIEPGRIEDAWEIEIPATGLPSFTAKSNRILWRVQTVTRTEGVDVNADFELLVVPEVVQP